MIFSTSLIIVDLVAMPSVIFKDAISPYYLIII